MVKKTVITTKSQIEKCRIMVDKMICHQQLVEKIYITNYHISTYSQQTIDEKQLKPLQSTKKSNPES